MVNRCELTVEEEELSRLRSLVRALRDSDQDGCDCGQCVVCQLYAAVFREAMVSPPCERGRSFGVGCVLENHHVGPHALPPRYTRLPPPDVDMDRWSALEQFAGAIRSWEASDGPLTTCILDAFKRLDATDTGSKDASLPDFSEHTKGRTT